MKTFVGVLLIAACFVASIHAYPGVGRDTLSSEESNEKKNLDTILVLSPEARSNFGRPVLDLSDTSDFDDRMEGLLPSSYFGQPIINPLDGFMLRMQDVMNRLREQMAGFLSRIPEQGVSIWDKIPEGANTTSTTKVVDGHVVTINETTYMDGDDVHGTLIRVRIIDVQPQNETILLTESEADAEVTTLPTATATAVATGEQDSTTAVRSVETVEDLDNEIPKNQAEFLTA